MQACRFMVTGRVQGVYFRASTCDQARRLGLRGYARNLDDGGVEVVAYGAFDALDELAGWLQHGPPIAEVAEVRRYEMQCDAADNARFLDDFVIA